MEHSLIACLYSDTFIGVALTVAVADGYAYVAGINLQIYDVDPPETAYLANTVYLPDELCHVVEIKDGYAYVISVGSLFIIDIGRDFADQGSQRRPVALV